MDVSLQMKAPLFILCIALCVSCAHTHGPFIQDGIRIVPPVTREGRDKAAQTVSVTEFNDGGTRLIKITDAVGQKFDVYIDHRIDTKTPGAIYLIDYPGNSNSVRVVDQKDFHSKIGELE